MTRDDLQQTGLAPSDICIRAVVLYSVMEFQGGNASTITVTQHGSEFSVSDDGRGHPLEKTLEGISYIRFIYTHFDYPFALSRGAPIQLQGIGMSFVNALCSELLLSVRKHNETLTASFKEGQLQSTERHPGTSQETGITVRGRVRPELVAAGSGKSHMEDWLRSIVKVHPTLRVVFNGCELVDPCQGAT